MAFLKMAESAAYQEEVFGGPIRQAKKHDR